MRILVATDGSAHSETALHLGVHLARITGGAVTILTVARRKANRPQANAILSQAAAQVGPDGADVQTMVRVGVPAEEIVREATNGKHDLMVLGSRTMSGRTKHGLGTTVGQVIASAPCPVVVTREKAGSLRRILLCDSGAKFSVLDRFTARLGELLTADTEVTVLHVMSQMSAGPGVRGWQLRATAEELMQARSPEGELLDRDVRRLAQAGSRPRPVVRHGPVVEEIVAEARDGDYDLVVIGARRSEGWQRFLLDNLAQQIMAQVDQPVLVMHSVPHETGIASRPSRPSRTNFAGHQAERWHVRTCKERVK